MSVCAASEWGGNRGPVLNQLFSECRQGHVGRFVVKSGDGKMREGLEKRVLSRHRPRRCCVGGGKKLSLLFTLCGN